MSCRQLASRSRVRPSFVLPTASVCPLEATNRATSRRHSPPARVPAAVTHCRLLIFPLSLFSVPHTSVKPDRPISEAHAEPTPVSYRTHAHAHIHTLARAHAEPNPFPSPLRLRIHFGNADVPRTIEPPLELTVWTFRLRYIGSTDRSLICRT